MNDTAFIELTDEQKKKINAFYHENGECTACRAKLYENQQRALLAQPQSDAGWAPGKLKVSRFCMRCHARIAAAAKETRP